jgi:hypothetical protein
MLERLSQVLTPELIASGLVGLLLVGVAARNAILGWYEARKKIRESEKTSTPFATALSLSWDKDQVERALQILERLAENMELQTKYSEAIARAQGILSDSFQQTTQSKLDHLLERIDHAEQTHPIRRRPRKKA